MEEAKRQPRSDGEVGATADPAGPQVGETGKEPSPQLDPSVMEEAGALIDNARTYAEAELGFQKTRAAFAGRLIGISLGLGVVALILLHIAFLALAVGLVLAFEPVVGIWGAIGIVFGGLMLIVALLGWGAFSKVQKLASLFSSTKGEQS
ncbi:MAG: phage holin family protein [Pseudomonadota bacterium]